MSYLYIRICSFLYCGLSVVASTAFCQVTKDQVPPTTNDTIINANYSGGFVLGRPSQKFFKGRAYFVESGFNDSTTFFDESHFNSHTNFSLAVFYNNASFDQARFDSLVDFRFAKFKSPTLFTNCYFKGSVRFFETQFDSLTLFSNTYFNANANFFGAKFNGRTQFIGTTLPDTLFFMSVFTRYIIDFTFSTIKEYELRIPKCIIDIYGTDIAKLKFDYRRFKIFINPNYSRSQVLNTYEQLIKMQTAQGFIDGYTIADKEYQHLRLTFERKSFGKFIGWVQSIIFRYWWGYGHEKWLILLWTPGLLLFFTLWNSVNFSFINENTYTIGKVFDAWKKRQPKDYSISKYSFVRNYTILYSFFYTSLIFFGLRLNINELNFNNPKGVLLILVQYTIGLICLAYLANFIIVN